MTFDPFTIIMLAVLAVLIFFMFRNSRKRQADARELQAKVVPGAKVTIEATDMMTFNLKTIRVPGDCAQLRVVLKHVGRMPAQAMGHNWVLTETRHHREVGLAGGRMKLADDFLPRNDARVLAHTPVIGGGQTTEVVFPTSRLRKGGGIDEIDDTCRLSERQARSSLLSRACQIPPLIVHFSQTDVRKAGRGHAAMLNDG